MMDDVGMAAAAEYPMRENTEPTRKEIGHGGRATDEKTIPLSADLERQRRSVTTFPKATADFYGTIEDNES